MKVSYNKLLKMLVDNNMHRRDLIEFAGVTSNVCVQISNQEPIPMQAAIKICRAFRCDIGDIMEFGYDDEIDLKSIRTLPGKMSDYVFQFNQNSGKMAVYKKAKNNFDGSFDLVLQTFVDPDDITPDMFPNDPIAATVRAKANAKTKKNE